MKRSRIYPIIAVLLLLAACIRFVHRTPTSQFTWSGYYVGLFVLGIVGLWLLDRIFKNVVTMCRLKGWLTVPLHHRYDFLFPFALVAVTMHFAYAGPMITDMLDERSRELEFSFGGWGGLGQYFVLAILCVVALCRVNDLIQAINESSKR